MANSTRAEKAGLPPGSLVHIGKLKKHIPKIYLLDYNKDKIEEKIVKNVEECFPFRKTSTVTWINIDGIHNPKIIGDLGKEFGFHPLLLEDIMNTEQRPKMDDFEDHIFITLKLLMYNNSHINTEQISIIIGTNFVISFQEHEGDIFDPIIKRIRENRGKTRKMGPDYLAYSLLDAVVDHYFVVLERLGEKIEDLEEESITNPHPETIRALHQLKREMISLRRYIWPLRDVISGILRSGSKLIKKTTLIYLRDVYDHTVQVMDSIETFRDILSGMMDVYLSNISNKMNEIMKVLTIIGTIFFPLTLVTGIYGMNFDVMPELRWKYGYFIVLGFMAVVAGFMLYYFRKRKWI
ncbi:MAG: magnesium and cobalt transport protein CorA [Candidatus Staskawiczbacteria bacterium RIFCSPHIGHO2_01_FULL_41_41]|uniref:Magnesium transport protein CorA n=1 Tax=Candidatus Staskawiczbacteria bacterium RIFCSPHIGHO2_01_FULL_41_41 TaxID=1802203 RepID=A0A1G2HUI4_9BACT|nr:MAG: magnesium and cobalt transport protein CorA [Candidatus Staskawiczbacteria bacterium RIFCSPHIGHO2_01_FULL_41_41]HLD79223.1 magnesium/cobalt transporter CorA [Candidatus Nanoarchaeia archaeon]